MLPLSQSVRSSVVQKYLMALTGIGLVVFIILHLLGNLTLLSKDGNALNGYAMKLHSFGTMTYVAEIGLAAVILVHAFLAMKLAKDYRTARGTQYRVTRTKGGPSKNTIGSRHMIITGVIIFAFLILHILQFRFGVVYTTQIHGEETRDLYRLAVEVFKQPLYVAVYTGVMIFLFAHLRHGFWSSFQSLGAMNPRMSVPIYGLGLVLAILLGIGFAVLPLYIYFNV